MNAELLDFTSKRRSLLRFSIVLIITSFCSAAHAAKPLQGFADFFYDRTQQAIDNTYNTILQNSDLIIYHEDNGVPWNEALWGLPYGASWQNELQRRKQFVPHGFKKYLALTPMSFSRNGLASYRNEQENISLPWPWDSLNFDHPYVMQAYLNHCLRMIDMYKPDYFAYAIEANLLWQQAPQKWPAFMTLLRYVYVNLKVRHPNLPVFVTLQVDAVHANLEQLAIVRQLLQFSDVVALSSYPYVRYADPSDLPADYFKMVTDLAPLKPIAIAETGWPAEDVTAPFPIYIPANGISQALYLDRILKEFSGRNALFVDWIVLRDYDALWDKELSKTPSAPLLRQWKDIGLINGNGLPRFRSWWVWNTYRSQ